MLCQHFFKNTPKWLWICVFHSDWMCWGIFILLPLPPTLPSRQILSQCCWFLSCDHYGNLASFLLLIYDLVNMPACQMVLFFRLGDNEINKNCCKKQIEGFFFFLEWASLHFYKCTWKASASAHCDSKQVNGAQWYLTGHWEVGYLFCALEFCPRKRQGLSIALEFEPACSSIVLLA